ncbi:MAG: phosphonate ABC transporter ATP-binding protein [Alphaproteobacteria bacterium]|nr:phosphonate ABC transporter ATP-binding protein [Alphaproteobacteria bacterium]
MARALLCVDRLSKAYAGRTVLDAVSLSVASGEVVAVLGASGAGKTTLFRCIAGLAAIDAGSVHLDDTPLQALRGRALAAARRDIGLVFQQHNLVRRLDALDNVLAGRLGRVPAWRVILRRFAGADLSRAVAALDRVGLIEHAHQRADTLSGGQQQRVAIARVLAQESRIILADEPVASLDPVTAAATLALLRGLARERGIGVLCNLHQVDLALGHADRIVGLAGGRIVVDAQPGTFDGAARTRVFGDLPDAPIPAPVTDRSGAVLH